MGLWREYAAVNAANCFPMPEEMTFEEAAAIPINYTTAYHMLFEMGNLKKGKSCLVHMVAGRTTTMTSESYLLTVHGYLLNQDMMRKEIDKMYCFNFLFQFR